MMKAIYRNKKYECRLRVLIHDTNSSTSLLKHMNEKNIGFSDTANDTHRLIYSILSMFFDLIYFKPFDI